MPGASIISMYDFDGTILNTMALHGRLAADCMHKYFGMPVDEAEERYHATTGIPFPDQLKKIFDGADPDLIKKCADEYIQRKPVEVYGESQPFPDVAEAVLGMRNLNIPQIVSTSTEQGMTSDLLEKHGMLDVFAYVRGLEQGKKPDHIEEARSIYKPGSILFTGDSEYDVGLSKMDGVITIGRTGRKEDHLLTDEVLKEAGANHVIYDLGDIIRIVATLNCR